MYCPKCGNVMPDGTNFCSNCGKRFGGKQPQGAAGKWLLPVAAVAVALAVFVAISPFLGSSKKASTGGKSTVGQSGSTFTGAVVSVNGSEGWVKEGGKTYYYQNGVKCVGVVEIDGDYYCFDDNGVLQINTTYEDENGNIFVTDGKGKVIELRYDALWGEWDSEPYAHGRGGKSSVMRFAQPVRNVIRADFFIQAAGNRGANADGNWIILVLINGQWMEYGTVVVTNGEGVTTLTFDGVNIEAITAYPEKTGSATYTCYYELRDVRCKYTSGDPAAMVPKIPKTKPSSTGGTFGNKAKPSTPAPAPSGSCGSYYYGCP